MEEKLKKEAEGLQIAGFIRESLGIKDTDIKTYSGLTLAYIGDSIYDLVIRTAIVESGNAPVNKLHKRASKLVQATAQAKLYFKIQAKLTEEEEAIYKRGRNAKSFTSAKNASIVEYRTATGVEALMGYLYLTGQTNRMMELIKGGLALITAKD